MLCEHRSVREKSRYFAACSCGSQRPFDVVFDQKGLVYDGGLLVLQRVIPLWAATNTPLNKPPPSRQRACNAYSH
jgi:hypothetical protein